MEIKYKQHINFENLYITQNNINYLSQYAKHFPEKTVSQSKKIIEKLIDNEPKKYKNIQSVLNEPLHIDVWKIVLRLFLQPVDELLQALYKQTIDEFPDPSSLTQNQRLGLLGRIQPQAIEIIRQFDWKWLACWLNQEGKENILLKHLSNGFFNFEQLVLRFSYYCNFNCAFCYNKSGPDRKDETLSVEQMSNLIRQMQANGLNELILTGGEPFMQFENLLRVIQIAKEEKIEKVSIYTNGFLG